MCHIVDAIQVSVVILVEQVLTLAADYFDRIFFKIQGRWGTKKSV